MYTNNEHFWAVCCCRIIVKKNRVFDNDLDDVCVVSFYRRFGIYNDVMYIFDVHNGSFYKIFVPVDTQVIIKFSDRCYKIPKKHSSVEHLNPLFNLNDGSSTSTTSAHKNVVKLKKMYGIETELQPADQIFVMENEFRYKCLSQNITNMADRTNKIEFDNPQMVYIACDCFCLGLCNMVSGVAVMHLTENIQIQHIDSIYAYLTTSTPEIKNMNALIESIASVITNSLTYSYDIETLYMICVNEISLPVKDTERFMSIMRLFANKTCVAFINDLHIALTTSSKNELLP